MNKEEILKNIAEEFVTLDYVDAVVLSGSQTGLINDDMSDYDMYVYSSQAIPLDFRKELAKKYTDVFSVGNSFFEDGDELEIHNPQICVDIMYRRLEWVNSEIDWVWRNHNAKLGFSTALLHNYRTSKILFDKSGEFQKIIDTLNENYPEELKENIIKMNYPLLRDKSASFYDQIKLALKRDDIISVNHRLTALLTSYFDILFAINGQTHPGEKKLLKYAKKLCPILPKDFEQDIKNVIEAVPTADILPALDKLINELDNVMP